MPGFNSYVGLAGISQKLLAATAANSAELQAAEPLRAQLEATLTQMRGLLTRRDTLAADKQVLSRQLKEVADQLNDLNIDLKTVVKGSLGSRSEKLAEFLVKPRRKILRADRPKTRKDPATEPTPESKPALSPGNV